MFLGYQTMILRIKNKCFTNLSGSMDPYQRAPRSPRSKKNTGESLIPGSEDCKSPTVDQVGGLCQLKYMVT